MADQNDGGIRTRRTHVCPRDRQAFVIGRGGSKEQLNIDFLHSAHGEKTNVKAPSGEELCFLT